MKLVRKWGDESYEWFDFFASNPLNIRASARMFCFSVVECSLPQTCLPARRS